MKPVPPSLFLSRVLNPGLDWTATHGGIHQSRSAAAQFLLTVALQEVGAIERDGDVHGLAHRAQMVAGDSTKAGPARGWWQFEQPTIGLLFGHPVAGPRLRSMCEAAWVRAEPDDVWRCLEGHDMLAVGVARLLLFTDPRPIPLTEAEAWTCYASRLWRPGKPHPWKWPHAWRTAMAAIGGH